MSDEQQKQPLLGNTSYDVAKDAVTIWLPALATFYAGLATIWGFPFSVEIVGTIGVLVVFLGVVLKISSNRYQNQYDGELIANDPDPMHDTFRLEFEKGLSEMASGKEVRLKVVDLLPKEESH